MYISYFTDNNKLQYGQGKVCLGSPLFPQASPPQAPGGPPFQLGNDSMEMVCLFVYSKEGVVASGRGQELEGLF